MTSDRFWPYPGATNPEAYELLNLGTDPERRLESLMWGIAPIEGKVLLDVGAGSGFHAVRYAAQAKHVYALEPDVRMRRQLHEQLMRCSPENVSVLAACAGDIPLADASVDIAHARFAYFFGTEDCLPGLREVVRVLRQGGHFFVIEAHGGRGQFGQLARQVYPEAFSDAAQRRVQGFFRDHGFEVHEVDSRFRAPDRRALEAVLRMDYPTGRVPKLLEQIEGTELSYCFWVFHYRKPG
jgi:ubiquinone/menaquinone biosynthesis C-methylase UbiE